MRNVVCVSIIVTALAVAACVAAEDVNSTQLRTIQLDPNSAGRVFEGIGAVSAGASTRLLPDYPEPQRSEILDYLFKPKFGAGFQHLKVEIGGGENSTCGCEPSHAITREELKDPKPRGYEFWLMAEARKRNPQIILDCLPWTYPHWVKTPLTQESADWFAAFLQVARKNCGLELEWIAAAQNEMGTDLNWIRKNLRPTLDAQGFSKVKLQAPDDDSEYWQIFDKLEKDPELDKLISAVGYHYIDGRNPWKIDQKGGRDATEKAKKSGKPLWASEEWSQSGGKWGDNGALYVARLINKLYARDRATKYEIWCPIDSIYDQIIWADTGAMQADTPWCGYYNVWPAVWTIAHTTQFAEPGWVYMDGACGQLDTNTWRGSHVAMRDPKSGDWSVIVVSGDKRVVRLKIAPGLKTGPVNVWRSTEKEQFVELPALTMKDGLVELELDADAVYSFTSTTGQKKGSHGTPPARKPFPFPYVEDFESYYAGDTPRYFSDQKGTFEVCKSPRGGLCLAQIMPEQGLLWYNHKLLKPHTLFGDVNWKDCVIEADVFLAGGDAEIGGRYADRNKLGYRWILSSKGQWQINWQDKKLAEGKVADFDQSKWHNLRLQLNGEQITGFVDGQQVAVVSDKSNAKGMAFLGSTYDRNLFDNVRVAPKAESVDRKLSPGKTTYYVDPVSGNDNNSGLKKKLAWRTFKQLDGLLLAPGDRLEIVAPGSFDTTLVLRGSGTVKKPVEVCFAPGRYDFYPDNTFRKNYQMSNTNDDPDGRKAVGILLEGAKHFRISGQDASVVCRGKMIEVCIDQSEDIVISGLLFDYHRPTVSEFSVTAIGDGYADIRIHKDSAYSITNGAITWLGEGWSNKTGLAQELDLSTGDLRRRSDPLKNLKLEETGPLQVRASGKHNMIPGHIYQIRDTFRDCAGVFTRNSKDITWKDTKFLFMHGMGLVNQFSENLTFDSVSIAPDEAGSRTTAAWADCLHIFGCRGKVVVKDCVFSGAHDDAINVHGTYLRVVERLPGNQIKVRFMHPQTFGFAAFQSGDEVEFVRWDSMAAYGTNRVKDANLINPKEMLLTLEQPVPSELRENDVLENATWTPELEIRGCTVRHIPTRGFLISTRRRVVVENNKFVGTHMNGISVSGDARSWFESGCVRDVTISSNRFVRCGEPVLSIHPENSVTNLAFHQNIRILDNEFILCRQTSVGAKSTRGLLVSGNMIDSPAKIDPKESIHTEDCVDVRIENNVRLSDVQQTTTAKDFEDIDWPAFMSRHDMVFNKLPGKWQEAPHFGNAMVGSMLYQEGNAIKLHIFRADVQDHRDDTWGWTAYSRPRLLIGYFLLEPVGKLTGCNWRKNLWNAELTGTITTDKGEIQIRHFTHAEDMAIVTELTPTAGEKDFSWTWHPNEARTSRPGYPVKESDIAGFAKRYGDLYEKSLKLYKPNPEGRLEKKDDTSVWVQDLLFGGQYATAWVESAAGETRTHIVSIANSYPKATAARTAADDVKQFVKLDRARWVESHRDWWHNYYQKSFVTIPDKGLESLYWQTIYRFGCTSRAGRCFIDTSGMWFQGGPWAYITTDWNIQSAHWPVYAANRLEQGEEIVNRLHAGMDALIKAVRPVEWQEDSAYLPIAVAWDMIGSRDGDMRYYNLVGNLPWTLNNAWFQYRYSMDDAMLRDKVYPLLRRSINLYLHMVQKGEDGKLHLPPTYSPESGVWKDCNFDLALFKWGCHNLLKASRRLGIDDPLIPKWKEVVKDLVDFPADEHGFRLGSDRTSSPQHRHFSNLLMIYPLCLANIDQADRMEVLKESHERAFFTEGLPAMVHSHAGPIGAVTGRGDDAFVSLKKVQQDLFPNGLWSCGGNPCIESTLSAAGIIQDMLLQSWSDPAKDAPGPIRIFPALPAEWKDVEFRDLRAEGAFLVSAKREDGKTKWLRIKSLAGEPCRVRPGINGKVQVRDGAQSRLQAVGPGIYQVDLKKGEEVFLQPVEDSTM